MTDMTRSERIAEEFFSASARGEWDRAVSLMAPGATVWQHGAGAIQTFLDALPGIRKMADRLGPWEYIDVRRVATETACCEQHTVRFHGAGDRPIDLDVCAVIRIDDDGRIVHLEEYFDQQSFEAARRR